MVPGICFLVNLSSLPLVNTPSLRCKIVDKHMTELCTKHFEARFIRLNAEKAPFLAERLKIKVMPTILMVKDSNVIDR